MGSFNHFNNKNRTIFLGMPQLPPTSQRMEGQSSQNPNPQNLKRMEKKSVGTIPKNWILASKQHREILHPEEISQIMFLERTIRSLEANVGRDFWLMHCWKQQHHSLQVENYELEQKMGFCSDKFKSQKAEFVKLMKEKEVLKEKEQQQMYEDAMKCNMANAQFMGMDKLGLPTYNYVGQETKML